MDIPMSDLHFRFMSVGYIFRDLFLSPKEKVKEAGIRPGSHVLDYGCGPGSYTVAAAELVGEAGKVFALDIHPLALQKVRKRASKKGLENIETILSNCSTGLESCCLDVVLLYDTFHSLRDPDSVLTELHRVLKRDAILSFSDHHLEESEILSRIPGTLFRIVGKGKRTYKFSRVE
jgi:ubiquinone/menaquinone biosynthesis C-methylase UbiE